VSMFGVSRRSIDVPGRTRTCHGGREVAPARTTDDVSGGTPDDGNGPSLSPSVEIPSTTM
jgi:hypothetical protein